MSTVQRNVVYPQLVDLTVAECPVCGVVYGYPPSLGTSVYRNGGSIFCPNGDRLGWDETDADRERKRAASLERRLSAERDTSRRLNENLTTERHRARALKGHLTRMKNRIANGVCPVPGCKRSGFANVMRHVASQHPDWHHEHAEELAP